MPLNNLIYLFQDLPNKEKPTPYVSPCKSNDSEPSTDNEGDGFSFGEHVITESMHRNKTKNWLVKERKINKIWIQITIKQSLFITSCLQF